MAQEVVEALPAVFISPDCLNCEHCAWDPVDDMYCSHEKAILLGSWGIGLHRMRRSGSLCGPEGNLFKQCTCNLTGCPRHAGHLETITD